MKQLTLGELIQFLEQQPEPQVHRKFGVCNPHSYRGYYNELAFEPTTDLSVTDMLAYVKYAVDHEFEGYKGGENLMTLDTPVWIAEWGRSSSTDLKITQRLLDVLFKREEL